MTYEQIKKIDSVYRTPFYLFDEKKFVKNYNDITKAFSAGYIKFILAYSYKTNYIPYLCKIIRRLGGYAEVVSRLEYDLALKVGQNPKKIIFNGPVKSYEDIALALDNHSIINLDCDCEVEHVKRYARRNPARLIKVGLRINIGLSDKKGRSHIQGRLKTGRFGFSPQKNVIEKVIESLAGQKNIQVHSLHGHTSTTDRSIWCYEVITKTLCDIADKYFPETIEYVNIGGGIFGYDPPKMRWARVPSFSDYARAVCAVLKKSETIRRNKPYLVLEPGVAMVANTLSFVTKVVSLKRVNNELFVTVDGSAFNSKPTFHKINQPYKILAKNRKRNIETYNVVGSTCMEKDYLLAAIRGEGVQPGDYIMIDNVGAYTIVLTPPFINPAPPVMVKGSRGYKIIRNRQTLKDIFCNYSF